MNATPRVDRWTPPTPEQSAAWQAEAERLRADHQAARAAAAPARRELLAAGPALQDLDAAVACHCSCHPRPADSGLHDGGTNCPCQQTPGQRAAALDELFGLLADLTDEQTDRRTEQDHRITDAAERLGIELDAIGGGAPFVIRGRVDGRGFYLRERHDRWRVAIAPDHDPGLDPWNADRSVPTIVVADGESDQFIVDGLFDEIAALETAVDAVRLFLLRRSCPHPGAQRFCPVCGVAVTDADAWRITTDS